MAQARATLSPLRSPWAEVVAPNSQADATPGTKDMFETAGFRFERHIGKSKTVMRNMVAAIRN